MKEGETGRSAPRQSTGLYRDSSSSSMTSQQQETMSHQRRLWSSVAATASHASTSLQAMGSSWAGSISGPAARHQLQHPQGGPSNQGDAAQGESSLSVSPESPSRKQPLASTPAVGMHTSQPPLSSITPIVGVTTLQSGSGFKKTFFKRHLPTPPATAFSSPQGAFVYG